MFDCSEHLSKKSENRELIETRMPKNPIETKIVSKKSENRELIETRMPKNPIETKIVSKKSENRELIETNIEDVDRIGIKGLRSQKIEN